MSASSPDILDRVLDPLTGCLTPEVARRIADLRADPEVQARLDQLADKANDGELSDAEKAEYDRYREALHFITIVQAKARSLLDQQSSS
jgi:hypothetical protein